MVEIILNFINFDRLIALLSFGFGIWQYKKQSELKKVVNDKVKRLYKDSKAVLDFSKKKNSYETIAERARSIKSSIIELDTINRNLTHTKINELEKKGELDHKEADEYKYYITND